MEYVEGTSLATLLGENPRLPLTQAIEVVEQVASALAEAHRNGVIRRDIKPANVFLDTRGRVKVGDFGIARLEGSELTQTGVSLGTPGYLAPEVVRGATASARSDIFALGVLAYQLTTGRRAFAGTTREALAIEVLERVPDPPRAVRPEIPEHVSSAIMRALDKTPASRTANAEIFLREMAGTARVQPTQVVPTLPATPRPGSRRLVFAALAAVAVLGPYLALRSCPRVEDAPTPSAAGAPRRASSPAPRPPARREAYPRAPEEQGELGERAREERKRLEEQEREARKRAEEHAREEAKRREEREREERKRREERERRR